PDATHGFFCDQRDSYHPEAARDAWEQVLSLFKGEL
ncbi:MAG: dienelactone hydrolase family protein, partial [Chloroflexaceae bacterium]|nr:dienelactone hydrolase family protein [Chloroflexaceae bacterium]